MKQTNRRFLIAVLLAAVILPYVVAALAAGEDYHFAGFLINPLDGASYLAKMQQGWEGAWRFTLPFTAEPGEGAYLFTFYLFLGHVARWTGLSTVLVFHTVRVLGALALLLALGRLIDRVFPEQPGLGRLAFVLAAAGSGMGWLLMFSGYLTSDAWVAEAYPFLSMFANPHFPIGLAILLWYFSLLFGEENSPHPVLLALAGLAISIILPFGVVMGLLVAGVTVLWRWLEDRRLDWQPLLWFGLLGGPFLLYQFWAAQTDPVLAGWNAQNVTITRPLWDVILALSPALPLALTGAVALWRARESKARRLLIGWFVLGLLLIYAPFSLQRRFMLGLFVPTALLAVFGIEYLRSRFARPLRGLVPALLVLSLLTNILLVLILLAGAASHAPELYLTRDEVRTAEWIRGNTEPDALVLASPQMGQWLPGLTGRRVLYGHPYETVNAAEEQSTVEDFFMGHQPELVQARGVEYIFYGPREAQIALNGGPILYSLPVVFQSGPVTVYQVQP